MADARQGPGELIHRTRQQTGDAGDHIVPVGTWRTSHSTIGRAASQSSVIRVHTSPSLIHPGRSSGRLRSAPRSRSYNRFASKHDLLDEVAHQGFVELREALLDEGGVALGDIDDPIDNIVEGLERYRRFAVGQPEIYGLMFDVQTGGFRISDRTFGTAFEALGVLIGAVDAAIAAGRIRADVDSLAAAQQIWAAAHGALRFELTEVGFVDDWHRHYTDIIHTMLRGLRPEVDAEPDTDGHPDTDEPRGA